MQPADLARRVKAIRLATRELGQLACVDNMTVRRVADGTSDPRVSTLEKIEAALVAEELRLRDYLVALHGVPEGLGRSCTVQAEPQGVRS
jgi:predicted transcriptional regulator